MAEDRRDGSGGGGLLDMERELTCSICTDILYQPLTLLDCLHTFCGSCSKEWFAWQAAAAASNRRTTAPYTCPSCRDSVRGTKADWRSTALLEGYLKANPDKSKTAQEKEEMREHYKPGDDVLPPVLIQAESDDSEDDRLMADVRELSMANVDPETAGRRAERVSRDRQRRRQEHRQRPEELGRQQQHQQQSVDESGRHIEHQPSLRSLLSDSDISSRDVQDEILQSIYEEGLLSGIDVDNLTSAQEEELTERIAEAYRRRQRNRERSRHRDRGDHSPQPAAATRPDSPPRPQNQPQHNSPPQQPQPQSRARPPISRPHVFEQLATEPGRHGRRSASSTSHSRRPSELVAMSTDQIAPAARSATDLSQSPRRREDSPRSRPRAVSINARSTTDPTNMRNDVHRVRNTPTNLRPDAAGGSPRPRSRDTEAIRGQNGTPLPSAAPSTLTPPRHTVRPVPSAAGFAPEAVEPDAVPGSAQSQIPPVISCSRCERPHIETELHYNCPTCDDGHFNLCQQCYRAGQGCKHWFGFGFMAMERWHKSAPPEGWPRGYGYPHVLTPRRYTTDRSATADDMLQEGAFCEICSAFANKCYWFCEVCQEGAWGFCNACVLQGKHCTHTLLPLAHISTSRNPNRDPSKLAFLPVPHLKPHSYVLLPVETDCDVCRLAIQPNSTRFHCYRCNDGDYDICNTCYTSLVATGKIRTADGPNGWRRCLQGHRMAVVGYQDTPFGGGQTRVTLREPVGGWRLKEDASQDSSAVPPLTGGGGLRYLATWSRFPSEEDKDELAFPRNAEVREGEDINEDWSIGVYAGRPGLFPSNHVRRLR